MNKEFNQSLASELIHELTANMLIVRDGLIQSRNQIDREIIVLRTTSGKTPLRRLRRATAMSEKKQALIEAISALKDEKAVDYLYGLNFSLMKNYNLLPDKKEKFSEVM